MTTNFNQLSNLASLFQFSDSIENLVKKTLNCCRVAIVDEFNPAEMTVKVHLVNKLLVGLNKDGSQQNIDYTPIYAKVHFLGWGNTGITYPIQKGSEGILLFADREIESWYVNGNVNNLSYERTHDITDAIFICGVYSLPNLINFIGDCLNIFYKNSFVRLENDSVTVKATGSIVLDAPVINTTGNLNVATGVSGTVSCGNTTLTFSDGILTAIA